MTMNEKLSSKYPDTKSFHFYNANPKGKKTCDCSIRAVSTALGLSYEETAREMLEYTFKTGLMINDPKHIDKFLCSKGWVKCNQPRKSDNTRYTGIEFCENAMNYGIAKFNYDVTRVIANMGTQHIVAIMDGKIYDTWDSSWCRVGCLWVLPIK